MHTLIYLDLYVNYARKHDTNNKIIIIYIKHNVGASTGHYDGGGIGGGFDPLSRK